MSGGHSRRPPAPASSRPRSRRLLGFGYDPETNGHHFAVVTETDGRRTIVERFPLEEDGEVHEIPKATLSAYLWERIANDAAQEFNGRLRAGGLRAGTWSTPETLLAPHFGKELTLLAWAVEAQEADPTPIPQMIANWRGLAPEERWWFYTTINATSTVAASGQGRGWRKAIKIAFAENPTELPPSALLVGPVPERRRGARRGRSTASTTSRNEESVTQGRLRLWDEEGDKR
jgi:hypothetical protein